MAQRGRLGPDSAGPAPARRQRAPEETGGPGEWPGRRLGLPESGPRSVARPGRRLIAIAVDWLVAMVISGAFFGSDPWATLAVFGAMQAVLVGTLGFGVGHALLGMRVERVQGGWAGPGRALIRSLLLCLAVPALVWDRDQRGLHDRAAGTVLLRR